MIYQKTDARLTSSLQSFSLDVLKWRNFENLGNILRDWAKEKGQKTGLAEALNRFEEQVEEI